MSTDFRLQVDDSEADHRPDRQRLPGSNARSRFERCSTAAKLERPYRCRLVRSSTLSSARMLTTLGLLIMSTGCARQDTSQANCIQKMTLLMMGFLPPQYRILERSPLVLTNWSAQIVWKIQIAQPFADYSGWLRDRSRAAFTIHELDRQSERLSRYRDGEQQSLEIRCDIDDSDGAQITLTLLVMPD